MWWLFPTVERHDEPRGAARYLLYFSNNQTLSLVSVVRVKVRVRNSVRVRVSLNSGVAFSFVFFVCRIGSNEFVWMVPFSCVCYCCTDRQDRCTHNLVFNIIPQGVCRVVPGRGVSSHTCCRLFAPCASADARADADAGAAMLLLLGLPTRKGIGMSASRHVLVQGREGEILLQAQAGGYAVSAQEAIVPKPWVRDIYIQYQI